MCGKNKLLSDVGPTYQGCYQREQREAEPPPPGVRSTGFKLLHCWSDLDVEMERLGHPGKRDPPPWALKADNTFLHVLLDQCVNSSESK